MTARRRRVLVFFVFLAAVHQRSGREDAGIGAHLVLDRLGDLGVLAEVVLGVLAALADALAVVGVPGARLLDDAGLLAEVDQLAGLAHALAVHDVELDDLERRRHLVLHHLDAGVVADDLVLVLERTDAADIEADRGIELQRLAARRGLGAAEHDADLHADLVDEDHQRVGLGDRGGELAQRLAHQAGVQAGQRDRPSRPRARPWAPGPRPSRSPARRWRPSAPACRRSPAPARRRRAGRSGGCRCRRRASWHSPDRAHARHRRRRRRRPSSGPRPRHAARASSCPSSPGP